MTTADVSEILQQLSKVLERLARIEERTSVLSDHETRIRAAEETARVAAETAATAKAVAEAQSIRIRLLEDAQNAAGKFTLGIVARVIIGGIGLILTALMIVTLIRTW